jgi:type II secretory pathway component PulF
VFSSKLPLANLIDLCRVLRHNLGAGLTLLAVFKQQGERGLPRVRPLAKRIQASLETGDSLEVALEREKAAFPPLFLSMAVVGEQTGQLPEIFTELEKYYQLQQKLRRQLISKSMGPLIQLTLAFFVIALLIFVLGMIAQSHNSKGPGILGFSGAAGSIVFLLLSFGTIFLLVAGYMILTRTLKQKPAIDAFLLRVPVLGPCIEAIVLGRFAVALQLTLETGMPIKQALRLSLQATGNAAFAAKTGVVVEAVKAGESLTEALSKCRLFPETFMSMVAMAEEGGRVPEIMRHQAEVYHEEAARRLTALTRMASGGVWLLYAIFMIVAIFKIANMYLDRLKI